MAKILGTLQVLDIPVEVVIATPKETQHLGPDDEGAYAPTRSKIYVTANSETDPARLRQTIVHEALHAAFNISGAQHYLELMSGKTGDALFDFEEMLIRLLTPALVTALPGVNAITGNLVKLRKTARGK